MLPRLCASMALALWTLTAASPATGDQRALAIVTDAFNYIRGPASISIVRMSIVRPDWQRTVLLKGWTLGQSNSLILILAPAKDKGNGTLKRGRQMWLYNPKINRVIKVPPSMMGQAWMGSDFSNNDLAKSDSLITDYTYSLVSTRVSGGQKVFVIKCLPKPAAPVIWGMLKLHIRQDHVLLREEFYDEDMRLVKAMTCGRIEPLAGKLFPRVWKMQKAGRDKEYTLLEYQSLQFRDSLPASLFTLSALRTPRR